MENRKEQWNEIEVSPDVIIELGQLVVNSLVRETLPKNLDTQIEMKIVQTVQRNRGLELVTVVDIIANKNGREMIL